MKGGIYSDERCPVCKGRFTDNHRDGLICAKGCGTRASRLIVRFGNLLRRFRAYDEAYRFLTGIRFKTDENTFSEDDYRKDRPHGFSNLYAKWIERKRESGRKKRYVGLLECVGRYASDRWGNRNISEIKYADIEDLKFSLKRSGKTKENYVRALRAFWTWASDVTGVSVPKFPLDTPELGYRKTVDKVQQGKILEEVKRISAYNPKIWLAIKFLSTYISIRPGEIVTLEEGNIDLGNGYLYFPHPKEKRYKSVPLTRGDITLLSAYPRAIDPEMRFFRHVKGSGFKEGTPFGQHVLYNWWIKARNNLGIEGVDLYGGTRHSSARALRKTHSPEQIKRATMHSTSKAFERYFKVEGEEIRSVYETASGADTADTQLIRKTALSGASHVVDFTK